MKKNYKEYTIHRVISGSVKNGDCLEYKAGKLKHKYGLISITPDWRGKRKVVPAHRALWMATHDCFDLPSDIVIRHKCDNPSCVNIEHLESGSHTDNAQDAIERGRKAKKHKPHTRQREVDNETVQAIRAATMPLKHIAMTYGVSIGYVSKLRSRKAKPLI